MLYGAWWQHGILPAELPNFINCICGALSSIVDPLGQTTTGFRDLQGRPTDKIYPDGSTVTFGYEDTASRLRKVTDAKHQDTLYQYFKDNDLKSIPTTTLK